MTGRSFKAYVHIFRGKGIESYLERFALGLEVNRTPYAFHHAEDSGVEVSFSSDYQDHLPAKILRRLLKFDLFHAFSNRAKIAQSDVVWAMTERESLAVAALMALRLIASKPIVSSSVWVVNEWDSYPSFLKIIVNYLSKQINVLTVQSDLCVSTGQEAFPFSTVKLMHFGINTDVFHITEPRQIPEGRSTTIFAAGNDETRDWKTFLAAFGNDSRFELRIWAERMDVDLLKGLSNVTRVSRLTTGQFIDEIKAANFTAVPMVKNIFSGITFALNSAALGTPIVCTDTGGVPTYFSKDEVLYTPLQSPSAMRDLVLKCTADNRILLARKAQERFLRNDYTTKAMVLRYVTETMTLL